VLVDEFQDTSREQWKLVSRLVESWGEGMGLAHDAPLQPSVFIVGDRKQSIYGFRDADVRVLRRATKYIGALRPGGNVRRSIARSFRSVPALLAFTNDLFGAVDKVQARSDAFRYAPIDRFPVHLATSVPTSGHPLGIVAGASGQEVATAVAGEIDRVLRTETVRDRQTGLARTARPGDVAILFRSRESHRDFESALEIRHIPTYVYKGLGFFDADEVKDLVALLRFLADPASDLCAAAFLRSRLVRLSDIAMRRLAPGFAAAASGGVAGQAGSAFASLPREDARVLERLHASVPRWLAMVDRLPPAEVLDGILDESAYAFEVRGPRATQARENVKKVRALLRRVQNRGYATLPRIAEHLDRLSAGDESNAIIDAADAVNLMTVHAAKGLEFPIVFLVNLGRGTGSHAEPIQVVADPRHHEPLVSIGGGLPDAEEATRARDIEETKRLLYVAVTRARERLYLSAVTRDGRFRPGRGSLGEVLPPGFQEIFVRAAAQGNAAEVQWQVPGGGAHSFRVCAALPPALAGTAEDPAGTAAGGPASPAPGALASSPTPAIPAPACDFAPWRDICSTPRAQVTTLAADEVPARPETGWPFAGDRAERRLAGTLVHRLFQAFDRGAKEPAGVPAFDPASVTARARLLASPDELAGVDDAEGVVGEAAASFLALRGRSDVAALLDSARCLYEVPFSLRAAARAAQVPHSAGGPVNTMDTIVRGTIDCLARLPGGGLVVVEIKTGRPSDWHQAQLEWYVRAAQALFSGEHVDGRILYA
jgi:ATP-dependent exoDNAse (exonuclease V) beta subunit